MKNKVAIFDIDGTMFRSSLVIEITKAFIEEGIFPARASKIFEEEHLLWAERRGSYEDYITKVVHAYRKHIKGVRLEDAMSVAQRLTLFHKNRVYRYTRSLLTKMQKTHFLLAISHSPYHIVEPFCREWGFQKVYSFFYQVNDKGIFTGKVEDEDLMLDKGKILKRAIEKEHLTLRGSWGVGDTESDIEFLNMVERPIAFNPNLKLYEVAKKKKWPIVIERKDVVYYV